MVELLGFNHKPFSVILWYKGEEAKSKTICYDQKEEETMVDRLNSEKNFYSMYDSAEIIRDGKNFIIRKDVKNEKSSLACL